MTLSPTSGLESLRLFRQLLRYSRQLQHTDRDYFARRIRLEFERHRRLDDPDRVAHQQERGRQLLLRNRFL